MKLNKVTWSLFFAGLFLFSFILIARADILNIEMSPSLDISRFAPYKITADISGSPTSVSVELNAINGDNPDPNCWDYYIDGTCGSEPVTKGMTYNNVSNKWESQNIYPDSIYPEIYFANSETTWYNAPSNLIMNRNSYQLFNFSNPFTMTDGMSFFIEFNAAPRAANSADLQVYLVKKDTPITFFNSNWLSSPDVSLVGTITKDDVFHHTHTANTSHHLVALTASADGTVNGLDISNDFWIVLYSSSPNNARGWDLRYHTTAVDGCSDLGRWHQGSQAGWSTTAISGCPDAHIHLARRITDINTTIQDGVRAQITANYASGDPTVTTQDFYFIPLINLAPNSTSFISPSIGGTYNENITVSWSPATDPNNDPLLYSIYLLNSDNQVISTLISATSTTSFIWDIGAVASGTYSLKGVVTEDISPDPLSTEFLLGGTFVIDKVEPLYTLNSINLSSSNASSTLAKAGDVITLTFTATGTTTPTVNFYSGGNPVTGGIIMDPASGSSFSATYTVHIDDTSGPVSFDISASNLAQIYDDTTDSSNVLVDVISPATVVSSPIAGTYNSNQVVSLSTSGTDYIKYTTNGAVPTCATGLLYANALNINEPTTIKALACDSAGNHSIVSTFDYAFQYAITYNGNSGSGHSPTTQLVNHGVTTTLPTTPIRTGYTFDGWNTQADGLGTGFDTTTVVNSNLTVYAIWDINSYTLTYDGNGETSGVPHPSETHDYNTVATIKNENNLEKTGNTFYGWNTQTNGSGVSYAASDTLTMTEDLTLYAQWLEISNCTVTFNGNGGSGHTPGTRTFACDSSLTGAGLAFPNLNPNRSGYNFNSWNMQVDGSGDTFTVDTVVNSNITVYAQWTGSNYNLNFNAQGENVSPTSTIVVYNSAVGSLPVPTRDDYAFAAWNTQADGSGLDYDSDTVYTVAGDTTLYAQWTGNNYNLNFNAQGGAVTPTSTIVVYNSAVGSLPAPTKSGYTFDHWNTQSDGSGTSYSSSTIYQTSGNLTLYAQWQANTYQIAFNSQFGSVVYNKTVTFNSPVGVLETPTRSGYIFSGWFTESNGEGDEYTSNTIYAMTGNKFLIAYWILESEEEIQPSVNNSGSTVSLPPGIGLGARDATVGTGASIGSNIQVGEITPAGVNVLTYITNTNNFLAPQSSNNWQPNSHAFIITDLDLLHNRVEVAFHSEPKVINLNLGESKEVDLDGDGISDIIATFSSLYVNRAEITIKSLSEVDQRIIKEEGNVIDYSLVIKKEKELTKKIDKNLTNRLNGRLLLQVEEKGQAWYLEPTTKERYFMGRPADAFNMMRKFGLGISEDNFSKFEKSGTPSRFAGRILLRAEANGEAYYINPTDMKMFYLGRPADAFNLMRELALGISNSNIRQILVGEVK